MATSEISPLRYLSEYSSWEDFNKAVSRYCDQTFQPFVKISRKKVETQNKANKNQYPEDMVYYCQILGCTHRGQFSSRGQGLRDTKSVKDGCKAKICATLSKKNTRKIIVKYISDKHNHEIGQDLYKQYAHTRALDPEERVQAEKLCALNMSNRDMRRELQLISGKPVTMQDVANAKKNYRQKVFGESSQSILQATEQVKEGSMSIRQAGRKYGIPYGTISDMLKGRLTSEEETQIATWIMELGKKGFGCTRDDIKDAVKRILDARGAVTKLVENRPGKAWMTSFFKRHPDLTMRTPQTLRRERALLIKRESTDRWFQEFKNYILNQDPDLLTSPDRIWNADEFGFSLTIKAKKEATESGNKAQNSRSQVTVYACHSASGQFLQPLIIYPYKRLPSENLLEGFLEAFFQLSDDGCPTAYIFHTWLRDVFIPGMEGKKRPVLLLMDSSNESALTETLTLCSENGILLYDLKANSSHPIQPLDRAFYAALKSAWDKSSSDFLSDSGKNVGLKTFASVFKKAWNSTATIDIAQKGFSASGIYPFNPSQILSSDKLAPSLLVTDENAELGSTPSSPTTASTSNKTKLGSTSSSPTTASTSNNAELGSISSPTIASTSNKTKLRSTSSSPTTASTSNKTKLGSTSSPTTTSNKTKLGNTSSPTTTSNITKLGSISSPTTACTSNITKLGSISSPTTASTSNITKLGSISSPTTASTSNITKLGSISSPTTTSTSNKTKLGSTSSPTTTSTSNKTKLGSTSSQTIASTSNNQTISAFAKQLSSFRDLTDKMFLIGKKKCKEFTDCYEAGTSNADLDYDVFSIMLGGLLTPPAPSSCSGDHLPLTLTNSSVSSPTRESLRSNSFISPQPGRSSSFELSPSTSDPPPTPVTVNSTQAHSSASFLLLLPQTSKSLLDVQKHPPLNKSKSQSPQKGTMSMPLNHSGYDIKYIKVSRGEELRGKVEKEIALRMNEQKKTEEAKMEEAVRMNKQKKKEDAKIEEALRMKVKEEKEEREEAEMKKGEEKTMLKKKRKRNQVEELRNKKKDRNPKKKRKQDEAALNLLQKLLKELVRKGTVDEESDSESDNESNTSDSESDCGGDEDVTFDDAIGANYMVPS